MSTLYRGECLWDFDGSNLEATTKHGTMLGVQSPLEDVTPKL
jgi:hypothetical protein